MTYLSLNVSALQTLEVACGEYESDSTMEDNLDDDDLIMVKDVLKEMAGMKSVEIKNINVTFNKFSLCITLILICIYCLILVSWEDCTRNHHIHCEE